MAGFRWVRAVRPGAAPGTLEFVGKQKVEKVRLRLIDYGEGGVNEREMEAIEECFPLKETPTVSWINIDGLHETETIKNMGEVFGLHPLLQEDILNTMQRPKIDEFDEHIFVTMKMIAYHKEKNEVHAEQLSLIMGSHWVITLQERVGDVFEPIRNRIRSGKGRIRNMGPDYLAYAIMDAVVDRYFAALEAIGDRVEILEEEMLGNPDTETLQALHKLKRQTIILRRAIWPLREVVSNLDRMESKLVKKATQPFLKDLYDHTIQILDTIEAIRDVIGGMMDLYISIVSNRMNEVMKVLTIIATIFIPITFVAGIYGMNFEYMPELGWHYAYLVVWGVIITVSISMLVFFRRLKWL